MFDKRLLKCLGKENSKQKVEKILPKNNKVCEKNYHIENLGIDFAYMIGYNGFVDYLTWFSKIKPCLQNVEEWKWGKYADSGLY